MCCTVKGDAHLHLVPRLIFNGNSLVHFQWGWSRCLLRSAPGSMTQIDINETWDALCVCCRTDDENYSEIKLRWRVATTGQICKTWMTERNSNTNILHVEIYSKGYAAHTRPGIGMNAHKYIHTVMATVVVVAPLQYAFDTHCTESSPLGSSGDQVVNESSYTSLHLLHPYFARWSE